MLWFKDRPRPVSRKIREQRGALRVAWFGHASGRRADGLTSYSREVVAGLTRRGVEVCFFSFRKDGEVTPVQRSVQLGAARFKTVTIPVPATLDTIRRELARFAPDVLHLSLSHSLLDAAVLTHARESGIATVLTVHLPYAPVHSGRGRVLYGLYRFHGRALRAADRCVALSADQRDLLLSVGCDSSRMEVLGNGVDTELFSPGRSRLRAELGAAFVVTYVGRIDPEKRVAQLVEAFLSMGWPDDHVLLIAGTGTRERQVQRMAHDAPQVHILGAVHDRALCVDLLRAADVFVLPSTAEGLSLSMLEAMATGCAVVATDVGEDGAALGDAGIRIPRDPLEPELSRALSRLHDDTQLRVALSRTARQRVQARYSLDARIDTLMRVYADLCGEQRWARSFVETGTEEAATAEAPA
jgi:glycosyltransferase involved in cell wall biosynthesis